MSKEVEDVRVKDSDLSAFVLGGKALFTIKSLETNNTLLFCVLRSKETTFKHKNVRYVYVKVDGKWNYIGAIYMWKEGRPFIFDNRPKLRKNDHRILGFEWFWYRANRDLSFDNKMEFKNAGKCARCGRTLTDAKSIERGFGPTCYKKTTKEVHRG